MGKNTLKFDTKGFSEYAAKLDALGADLRPIFDDALTQAGETIARDTHDAVKESNLPAGGKYSEGDTDKSIIDNPKVEWSGNIGSIGVGFDYSRPGAGGYLITGTPKMKPDRALNKMYKGKKYMKNITEDINEILQDELKRRM